MTQNFIVNLLLIVLLSLVCFSCQKTEPPLPPNTGGGTGGVNTGGTSSTFESRLKNQCNNYSLNCEAFKNRFYLVNKRHLLPESRTMQFGLDYDKILYLGNNQKRLRFKYLSNDCSKIRLFDRHTGDFVRDIEILHLSNTMTIINDPALCPDDPCTYISRDSLSQYLKDVCSAEECNCGDFKDGKNCLNSLTTFKFFSRDDFKDIIYDGSDYYLATFDVLKKRIAIVSLDGNFSKKRHTLLEDNAEYRIVKIHDLNNGNIEVIYNYENNGNHLARVTMDKSTLTVLKKEEFKSERLNFNFDDLEYDIHKVNDNYFLQSKYKLFSINFKRKEAKSFPINSGRRVSFRDNEILAFHGSYDNFTAKLTVSKLNSLDLTVVSSNEYVILDTKNDIKSKRIELNNIQDVKVSDNFYFIRYSGYIREATNNGLDARNLVVKLDKDFNIVSMNKLNHFFEDYIISMSTYKDELFISSKRSGQFGAPIIGKFGDKNLLEYIHSFNFGLSSNWLEYLKPQKLIISQDKEAKVIFSNNKFITLIKFNERSRWTNSLCN